MLRDNRYIEESLNNMMQDPHIPEEGFETIIGERNTVTGNISGDSPICINGTLSGNIDSGSYVYISKCGKVVGDVTAKRLVLNGTIEGSAVKADTLIVTETGTIKSDVTAGSLTVKEGGVLSGRIAVIGSTK